jgi:hypothetical protein
VRQFAGEPPCRRNAVVEARCTYDERVGVQLCFPQKAPDVGAVVLAVRIDLQCVRVTARSASRSPSLPRHLSAVIGPMEYFDPRVHCGAVVDDFATFLVRAVVDHDASDSDRRHFGDRRLSPLSWL